jgi:hypothetical protein
MRSSSYTTETGHGESAFGAEALPSKNQEAPISHENIVDGRSSVGAGTMPDSPFEETG